MNLFILGGGLVVLGLAWVMTAVRAFVSDNIIVMIAHETSALSGPCFLVGIGILLAAVIQWFSGHVIHITVN